MVLPDVSFRGKIDEEDLKDDTCAKEEDSRGEYSEVAVDRVVKENGNVENYCEKDYDDTGNMGDGSKDEEHQDGSSMEDDGTKEEDHQDGSSVEDYGTKEEDHEDGGSVKDYGTKEEDHEGGGSTKDDGTKEEDHEDGGSMIDDDNADDTSVNKEEANENGGRDVKEHTDMKRNPNKINSCPGTPLATVEKHLKVREKANDAYLATAKQMTKKYSKQHKVKEFLVGENVSLRIPRIDRTCSDMLCLPCVIVQISGEHHSLYRLRCSSGVLQRCYRADDLEPFKGDYSIPVDGWEVQPIVTLKEAASKQSPWNSFTANKCNCKPGTCESCRCRCKKNEIECSSHCHKGDHCKNKQQDIKIPNQG